MTRILTAACAAALLTAVPLASAAQQAPSPPGVSPSPAPQQTANPVGPAFGANDPCTTLAAIVTRPSVTNSVCTVRPNHVEIETGYLNTTSDGGGNTVTYPQTLIRIGTRVPALEFDLAPPGITRTNASGITTGSTDAGAGVKYVFGYTPKFNYGAQVFFTAPTGLNGFSNGGSTASYALNAGYALSPLLSLGTTVTAQSLSNGAQRWSALVPSLVLGASLPNATGVGVEIAQFTHANGPGSATRTQYLGSIYRDFGQRVQLDASFAFSPTAATGRYRSVGFGASFYF